MHLIKYRLLQALRETATMFWALLFPILLGTFFYFSFWSLGEADNSPWQNIAVGVVTQSESADTAAFGQFLDALDGEILQTISYMGEEEALIALDSGIVSGIYIIDETPSLTVNSPGTRQSILKSLLDNYVRNAAMVKRVAADHPERLEPLLRSLFDQKSYVQEMDLGGRTANANISYFLALIAYACMNGSFMGVTSSYSSQANLSALGLRRSITPTSKLVLVLTDLLVLVGIHFSNISILTLYLRYVLHIPIRMDFALFLINLMGSILGISIGLLIGSVSRKSSFHTKLAICQLCTIFPGFLAGLMYGKMKNIIEKSVPILNRINPAAVLSDAYYCISVYDNPIRFGRDLIILAAMSVLFLTLSFLYLRKERYDSL